jgi:hypothetical protein
LTNEGRLGAEKKPSLCAAEGDARMAQEIKQTEIAGSEVEAAMEPPEISPVRRKGKRAAGKQPGQTGEAEGKKEVDVLRQLALVRRLIRRFETKLATTDMKASLGDLLRLMQIERELAPVEPREIVVRWVDPEAE